MAGKISTEEDDWLKEVSQRETRWVIELTNGVTVYQDDYRPNVSPYSAWMRLKSYCSANKLGISFMRFQFRTHCEDVGRDGDAYFFSKALLGALGEKDIQHFYIAGMVKKSVLTTTKWVVPALIPVETRERNIDDSQDNLIWTPKWLRKEEATKGQS